MRLLILMRHAKSSWRQPSLSDHDRPLNGRGRAAAAAMGAWLKGEGLSPDHVLCSNSARTRETWRLTGGAPGQETRALYLAGPDQMLALARQSPDTARIVMMIAHEPGTSALAQRLAQPPVAPDCARAFEKYPTCAISLFEADIAHWADLAPAAARFTRFVTPKEL